MAVSDMHLQKNVAFPIIISVKCDHTLLKLSRELLHVI